MTAKKRINNLLFFIASLLLAAALGFYTQSWILFIVTMAQYGALSLLANVVTRMLLKAEKSKKALFFLFMTKSFLTFGPFFILGFFYEEMLLWALLGYILVLLIFFISIKRDGSKY